MPTGTYGSTLGDSLGTWIKIYDKDLNLITTLLGNKSGDDFVSLSYNTKINGAGSASFIVRIDNSKITTASMNHFNRIKICDYDGTERWYGYIDRKELDLNIIRVSCVGMLQLLGKRITEDALIVQGEANAEVADLLSFTNGLEETGITMGDSYDRPVPDLFWSLNENTGVIANDSVGVNHGSIQNGASFVTGKIGTGIDCSALGQIVTPTTPLVDTGAYTLNIWLDCPLATPGSVWNNIISRYGGIGSYHMMAHTDGRFGVHFGGAFYSVAGFDITALTGWHMFTSVCNAVDDSTDFYLDGEFLGTVAKKATSASGIGAIGNVNNSNTWFIGSFDNFEYHSKALTPAQIKKIYDTVDDIAFYKFNNTLADTSLQNNLPVTTGIMGYDSAGKFAEAGAFTSGNQLTLADNDSWHFGLNSFSIECWIKTTTATQYLYDSRNGVGYSGGGIGYNIKIVGGILTGGLGDGPNYFADSSDIGCTTLIDDGEYHHAIISYDRTLNLQTVYIDGIQDGQRDISTITGILDNTSQMVIGAAYNFAADFVGSLDNFRIIGHSVDSEEAYNRYNADYTAVDLTFNRTPILSAIKSIAEAVDCQYKVTPDGKLQFKKYVGSDVSSTLIIRYDKTTIENSNILNFNVEDNGSDIVSRTIGVASALTSDQEDATLQSAYGLLELFKNFREQNDQATLDGVTENQNIGPIYSPRLELNPLLIVDNFDVGDIIKLELNNDFLAIDQNAQIIFKQVTFVNAQKKISIVVDSEERTVLSDIKSLQESVDLINREL